MKQIVDLQNDSRFQGLNLQLVSINVDATPFQEQEARNWGFTTPMLADEDLAVSGRYGVRSRLHGGEPGHAFVLVGQDGLVKGIKDYSSRENGELMYVEPSQVYEDIASW